MAESRETTEGESPTMDLDTLASMATQASLLIAADKGVGYLLAMMLDLLGPIGWQKLGLQPNPLTGKTQKDLAEAKLAIDAANSLASVLQPVLEDEDRRRVQNLVRDLKINFVEQSKAVEQIEKAQTEPEVESDEAPEEEPS